MGSARQVMALRERPLVKVKNNGARTLPAQVVLLCVMGLLWACDGAGLPRPQTVATLTVAETATARSRVGTTSTASTTSLGLATATSLSASQVRISPTPTLIAEDLRRRIFDEVWSTVDKNYLYAGFGGVDWQATKAEYEPKVRAAKSAPGFYGLLSEMVERLGDEHSRFLSPWEAREEDSLMAGETNYVGIGVLSYREQGSMVIVYVFPNSPAEEAGLKRRDRILEVDGEPLGEPTAGPSRIRGPEGTTVHLRVRSPGQSPREVAIVRRSIRGSILPSASRLEADRRIGYLVVPDLFVEETDENVERKLEELLRGEPLEGLVLDMRGNGGGLRSVLESILSHFVSGRVGEFFTQKESYPFQIASGRLYNTMKSVPLVVLVDGGTESNAEVLAGVLQAQGRAKVVGVPTAGNTETIYAYDLDDGSRLWVAQEGFKLPDGTNMEGRGVLPDEKIDVDWTNYDEEHDPHILKAIELLRTKK